jgi:GNAT superfamily N-acetyltransferase
MSVAIDLRPLPGLPPGIEVLRAEATAEGFRFMDRLVTEWHAGITRFDQPGEALFGAYHHQQLVAVCGLGRDRYTDQPRIGRLRHLYVLQSSRRHGVATALVHHLLIQAQGVFDLVRLKTDSSVAGLFYERQRFDRIPGQSASHMIAIK